MKLILIDGGPAAGKNTLGELVAKKFQDAGNKTILLDLDTYVEELNPRWIWENDEQKESDQSTARVNIAKDIDTYLKENYQVIVIGERFLTKEDVFTFVKKLKVVPEVFLYHLSVPFTLREQRLHQRGPHSLIDLTKDQKDRDLVTTWPGFVYANIHSPQEDAENLFRFIQEEKGAVTLIT